MSWTLQESPHALPCTAFQQLPASLPLSYTYSLLPTHPGQSWPISSLSFRPTSYLNIKTWMQQTLFIEHLCVPGSVPGTLSASGHCAQHFTDTISSNPHGSPGAAPIG